jgi:hypothetical protein
MGLPWFPGSLVPWFPGSLVPTRLVTAIKLSHPARMLWSPSFSLEARTAGWDAMLATAALRVRLDLQTKVWTPPTNLMAVTQSVETLKKTPHAFRTKSPQ